MFNLNELRLLLHLIDHAHEPVAIPVPGMPTALGARKKLVTVIQAMEKPQGEPAANEPPALKVAE